MDNYTAWHIYINLQMNFMDTLRLIYIYLVLGLPEKKTPSIFKQTPLTGISDTALQLMITWIASKLISVPHVCLFCEF